MRAAIIGLGQIAWRYDGGTPLNGTALTHLSTLKLAGVEVICGADPSATARKDFTAATGLNAVEDVDFLLAQSPNIVTIASPNALHAEHLLACINAGVRYVWLEKPLTADTDIIADLAARADAQKIRVLVGFQRRYMPVYQELLKSNLGKLTGIEITYSRGLETNGSHLIDLLLWLLDDERPEVIGVIPGTKPLNTNEPSPSFLLRGANGIPVTVMGMDLGYHSIDIVVHYSEGRRSVRWGGQQSMTEKKIANPLHPGFFCLGTKLPNQPNLNTSSEIANAFPTLLQDLLYGIGQQPISNLHNARLVQSVVAEVLKQCA
jgi:predicted dehydrogenase